ncbi:hypothetical protein DL764_002765 [Monosporascus ibericus]|uniref:Uncharacterized protein n=1 Tax=Monosporascus ibericus TaxID=155417 RepID=A0A4Q4TKV2_9PEZI|nr:hypothetical protein DL764_002765 [Monosporascus ibericus]
MSADSQPISPARFAEALKDLPASSLALKVLELRNSIAFLDYSNAELKPFAEGTVTALDVDSNSQQPQQQAGRPDQDCIDAIAENEVVIARMQERIELVRAEVESRGLDWCEFQGKPEEDAAAAQASNGTATSESRAAAARNLTNGVNEHTSGEDSGHHEAWRDGTFQTGTIQGVRDVELLQQLMDRMPRDNDDDDPEGGMHL